MNSKQSLKIMYLSDSRIPSSSANSIHVMKMCNAFASLGHELTLIAQSTKNRDVDIYAHYDVDNKFRVKHLYCPAMRGGRLVYVAQMFNQLFGSRTFDLVYGRSLYGLALAASLGYQVVYEAHTPAENATQRKLESWLLKHAGFNKLVVINSALRDHFLTTYPFLQAEDIVLAHDGADIIDTLAPSSMQWQGRPDALKLGYIGQCYPGRGLELIMGIAAALPDCDVHIIGGTAESIQQYQTACQTDNVFFYGQVPFSQTESCRRYCDILLAPYQHATSSQAGINTSQWMSPLKIFEYMASGRAIVASDLPAIMEILKDGYSALLCDPEDLNTWLAAIGKLEQKDVRDNMAKNAFDEISQKYQWKQRAEMILENINLQMP